MPAPFAFATASQVLQEERPAESLPVQVGNNRTDFRHVPAPALGAPGYPLRFGPSNLAHLPLKDGDEFVRPDVAFVLGPFLLGELTFGRFGGQIIDPSLKLRVRPIIQDGFGFVRQNDSQNGANPPVERSAFWCRYHGRTIPNTIHFRKRKKKASVTFHPSGPTAAAFLFVAHWTRGSHTDTRLVFRNRHLCLTADGPGTISFADPDKLKGESR